MAVDKNPIGAIPGIAPGTTFPNREALREAGLHRPRMAGIAGTGATGAESIVISGGYEDDEDHGDVIVYTGHGGRDSETGKQIRDQSPSDPGNAALITSCLSGAPVRVIRKKPPSGYRYDGLFRVESYWSERGKSGFMVCRYRLVQEERPAIPGSLAVPAGNQQPGRATTQVQRVVRSSLIAEFIKKLYDYTCQICRTRLDVGTGGGYAEGAHIRALGAPHNGPDVVGNVLCLCPNCHVLFDHGAVRIDGELIIRGGPCSGKKLYVRDDHKVDRVHFNYHRSIHIDFKPHP